MDARGTNAIARLTKHDVEALLADFDSDPIVALTVALRRVLERPESSWPDLVRDAGLTESRSGALLRGEQPALDELAAELNELRTLQR